MGSLLTAVRRQKGKEQLLCSKDWGADRSGVTASDWSREELAPLSVADTQQGNALNFCSGAGVVVPPVIPCLCRLLLPIIGKLDMW